VVVAVVLVGGCDALFSIGVVATPDSLLSSCGTPVAPADTFTSANPPCTPWGTLSSTNGPTVTSGDGLQVTIDDVGFNGCYASRIDINPTTGLFMEVDNQVHGGGLYSVLHAYAVDPGDLSLTFVSAATALELRAGPHTNDTIVATTAYGDDAGWWRLRVVPTGIAGDVSRDGLVWRELAVVPGHLGPLNVAFGAGSSAATPPTSPPTVVFRNFNTCPAS
jgi:hypothetical protein